MMRNIQRWQRNIRGNIGRSGASPNNGYQWLVQGWDLSSLLHWDAQRQAVVHSFIESNIMSSYPISNTILQLFSSSTLKSIQNILIVSALIMKIPTSVLQADILAKTTSDAKSSSNTLICLICQCNHNHCSHVACPRIDHINRICSVLVQIDGGSDKQGLITTMSDIC